MGSNQSWLQCDKTYPGRTVSKYRGLNRPESGNLLIAVILFMMTMLLLFLLVTAVNCLVIWRRRGAGASAGGGEEPEAYAEAAEDSDSSAESLDSVTVRAAASAQHRRLSHIVDMQHQQQLQHQPQQQTGRLQLPRQQLVSGEDKGGEDNAGFSMRPPSPSQRD